MIVEVQETTNNIKIRRTRKHGSNIDKAIQRDHLLIEKLIRQYKLGGRGDPIQTM